MRATANVPANPPSKSNARITVVFRYDDCNSESSIFLEQNLIDAFGSCSISLTLGVTPFVTSGEVDDPATCAAIPLGSEKIKLLQHAVQTTAVEIALHGVSHQTIRLGSQGGCTEFAGLSRCAQYERLARGKQFLETTFQAPVTTLIPPWNSFDENTLHAAQDAGLITVSADADGLAPPGSPLQFVPVTCHLSGLRSAIRWARMTFDPAPIIVVLFHPYDFSKMNKPRPLTVDLFLDLLKWVSRQTDVSTLTIAGLGLRGDDVSSARLERHLAARASRMSRLIPGRAIRNRVYGSIR